MSDHLMTSIVTVLTSIIGLAILALLVSRNANTAGVLQAGGSAFAGILGAAEAPVTGSGGILGTAGNLINGLTGSGGINLHLGA